MPCALGLAPDASNGTARGSRNRVQDTRKQMPRRCALLLFPYALRHKPLQLAKPLNSGLVKITRFALLNKGSIIELTQFML